MRAARRARRASAPPGGRRRGEAEVGQRDEQGPEGQDGGVRAEGLGTQAARDDDREAEREELDVLRPHPGGGVARHGVGEALDGRDGAALASGEDVAAVMPVAPPERRARRLPGWGGGGGPGETGAAPVRVDGGRRRLWGKRARRRDGERGRPRPRRPPGARAPRRPRGWRAAVGGDHGAPQAIASKTGRPKPSIQEGNGKAWARL